jgi:hypothetical protein
MQCCAWAKRLLASTATVDTFSLAPARHHCANTPTHSFSMPSAVCAATRRALQHGSTDLQKEDPRWSSVLHWLAMEAMEDTATEDTARRSDDGDGGGTTRTVRAAGEFKWGAVSMVLVNGAMSAVVPVKRSLRVVVPHWWDDTNGKWCEPDDTFVKAVTRTLGGRYGIREPRSAKAFNGDTPVRIQAFNCGEAGYAALYVGECGVFWCTALQRGKPPEGGWPVKYELLLVAVFGDTGLRSLIATSDGRFVLASALAYASGKGRGAAGTFNPFDPASFVKGVKHGAGGPGGVLARRAIDDGWSGGGGVSGADDEYHVDGACGEGDGLGAASDDVSLSLSLSLSPSLLHTTCVFAHRRSLLVLRARADVRMCMCVCVHLRSCHRPGLPGSGCAHWLPCTAKSSNVIATSTASPPMWLWPTPCR